MSAALAPGLEAATAADGTVLVRQGVETGVAAAGAKAASRILFINKNGGMVRPGANDSRTQTSSIVSQPTTLAGWAASASQWKTTMDCVREMWAPFAVTVTDVDPGDVAHLEAMVGDVPSTLGLPSGVGGVSPMSLSCGVIENSIVYAFPSKLGNNPQRVCEVIAQELGHSYGLDHELLASDPMTYLSYAGKRRFRDQTAACGETDPRPCGLDGHTCRADQNSVAILRERLGVAGADETPPEVEIMEPTDGEIVSPGFTVIASATDDIAVAEVTLFLDGDPIATRLAPPYEFATDDALGPGGHRIEIEVVDEADNTTTQAITVRIVTPSDGGPDLPDVPSVPSCSAGGAGGGVGIGFVLLALVRGRRRVRPSRA